MYSEFTKLLLQFILYLDKLNDQVSHYFYNLVASATT